MQAHHRHELTNRLERLSRIGAVSIERAEILSWYGQERFSKNIWRDIKARWEEIAGAGVEAFVWEADGLIQFIYPEGFTELSQKAL